ncbi:MAG: hypothetical protein AAF465_08330 [Pseudomonadota bacterium]
MNEHRKSASEHFSLETEIDSSPTGNHPEWHPFAVWQEQIRKPQRDDTVRASNRRILRPVPSVDA